MQLVANENICTWHKLQEYDRECYHIHIAGNQNHNQNTPLSSLIDMTNDANNACLFFASSSDAITATKSPHWNLQSSRQEPIHHSRTAIVGEHPLLWTDRICNGGNGEQYPLTEASFRFPVQLWCCGSHASQMEDARRFTTCLVMLQMADGIICWRPFKFKGSIQNSSHSSLVGSEAKYLWDEDINQKSRLTFYSNRCVWEKVREKETFARLNFWEWFHDYANVQQRENERGELKMLGA